MRGDHTGCINLRAIYMYPNLLYTVHETDILVGIELYHSVPLCHKVKQIYSKSLMIHVDEKNRLSSTQVTVHFTVLKLSVQTIV